MPRRQTDAPRALPDSYSGAVADELQRNPPRSKGERTRRRLELAALNVLETTGYSDMRVLDVARQADVSQGTFYFYYPDKRDIAAKVLLEFGEALYQGASTAATGHTVYDAILLTNKFFVHAYDQNRGLIRCLVQLDDSDPQFQQAWRRIRYDWIGRIAGSIGKRNPGALTIEMRFQMANALEGMVFHFLYDLYVREEPQLKAYARDRDQVAELLSMLWYRALFSANPAGVEHSLVDAAPFPEAPVRAIRRPAQARARRWIKP
jgi:AcrR family transcriptional regulator